LHERHNMSILHKLDLHLANPDNDKK
jgi:hypothetical protein